jgi:plasmid stabilization system protein ParE
MSTQIENASTDVDATEEAISLAAAIVAHNDQCVDFVEMGRMFVEEIGGQRKIVQIKTNAIKQAVEDGDIMTAAKLLAESQDWLKAASERGKQPIRAGDLETRQLALALDFIGKVDAEAEAERTERLSDTFGD